MKYYDLAIIGAGIMGLAHAIHAARSGLKVAVFERDAAANGASVRNFGMLAIVAQAPGAQLDSARRALACWQEVASRAGLTLRQAGCVFLARAPQELSVMQECAATGGAAGHTLKFLNPSQLHGYVPSWPLDGALGGLWSPDAWKIDQRHALVKIAAWLAREENVSFHYETPVHGVESGVLDTPSGPFRARHTILCSGSEFTALFPEAFLAAQISQCQLQMLRTVPQSKGWRLDPFVLGGLSLTRYGVFANCPSLPALKDHQRQNFATHLKHGIHVIACQEEDGSVTIGDSHAYDTPPENARSELVDKLILEELAQMILLQDPQIADRWLGHYAHFSGGETRVLNPAPDVTAVTMTNGQGMTHAFSVAEGVIRELVH